MNEKFFDNEPFITKQTLFLRHDFVNRIVFNLIGLDWILRIIGKSFSYVKEKGAQKVSISKRNQDSRFIPFVTTWSIALRRDSQERGFQEVLNEISFSRFLEQVDSKIWRVHLLILGLRQLWEMTITERNMRNKGRAISKPGLYLITTGSTGTKRRTTTEDGFCDLPIPLETNGVRLLRALGRPID